MEGTKGITLAGINTPASPTWNRLSINGRDLVVPAADLVEVADDPCMESGLGHDALSWIRASATACREIEVAARETLDEPLEVRVDGAAGQVALTSVTLGEGSRAHVCVVAASGKDGSAGLDETGAGEPVTCASRLELGLETGAHADVHVICSLPDACRYLDDMAVRVGDGASVRITYHLLGAGETFVGMRVDCVGYRSSCAVDVHYLGRGEQVLDMNHHIALCGRKTRCDFDAYGVLGGTSSKTLRDTIDLVHGCKGAAGREQETVLLANQGVTNKSLPVVLCDEDDVAGDHGATIGAVSPEQLAYLTMRGLTEQEVEALFARSVLDSALSCAPTEHARAVVVDAIGRILGEQEARESTEILPAAAAGSEEE